MYILVNDPAHTLSNDSSSSSLGICHPTLVGILVWATTTTRAVEECKVVQRIDFEIAWPINRCCPAHAQPPTAAVSQTQDTSPCTHMPGGCQKCQPTKRLRGNVSCVCLVRVDNTRHLEGVVPPSYFYYPILECLLKHVQGPSKSGYPTAKSIVHTHERTLKRRYILTVAVEEANNVLVPQSVRPQLISTDNPLRSQAFAPGIMLAQITTTTPYLREGNEQSYHMQDQNRMFGDSKAKPAEVQFGTIPSVVESLLRWILRLMDYLPELTDNGHNWMSYGNSVLCAINDEGLMGFLVGSERRPIHPAELEGRGKGWTPRTDEERDEVAVWRTADQSWTQRNATVNYMIICGIPDTIFTFMLHLKSPLEKWDYLENRFGRIPRPESWLAAGRAMQQNDLLPEESAAGETAQSTCDSHDEPDTLPGEEGGSSDSSNDCTEIETGYLTPEPEVVDARQVEDNLPEVEVGDAGGMRLDECTNALEAPDEGCQYASDKVEESRDLPELSSKALEPEENRHTRTSSETTTNVPDPPGTHAKFPTLQIESSMLQIEPEVTGSTLGDPSEESEGSSQLRETERPDPHRDRMSGGKFRIFEGRFTWDAPPNEVWGMGVHKHARVGMGDSRDVEPITTKLWISPLSAKTAGMRNAIPTPPEPPPIGLKHAPSAFMDPRHRGRIKTKAENVSNAPTRRSACRAQAVLVRPLTPLLAPSKPSTYPAGGLWTMNIGYEEVRCAKRDETRVGTYLVARIPMRLLRLFSLPSKRLRYPTGGLRMVSVRCNEVSIAREVQTRGYPYLDKHRQACVTLLPFLAPRKRLKPPWGVLRPYRRQGVPPEHTRSVDKPSLFEAAASQQRYKAEDSAQQEYSRNGSCDNAARQTRPNIARTWTRSSPAAEYTRFIDGASGGVLEIESPLCDVHFVQFGTIPSVVESLLRPFQHHVNFFELCRQYPLLFGGWGPDARRMGRSAYMAVYVAVSKEALDPLPTLGWVMERNESCTRKDDYILQVATFLANDIPVSSNVYLPNHIHVFVL
ncbi:hypothetical protein EDD15DRAFT_2195852 [Pisolithus albus]|nr:hypothetical protein EDD15DRAFT_2195852 [Pisolithus albus]